MQNFNPYKITLAQLSAFVDSARDEYIRLNKIYLERQRQEII